MTTEPKGKVARKRGSAFVIQKHDARRLHYDLRLELDGVMKSWAVTRGPSLVPGEKRLAVHVEDHPIAYNKFEGIIPEGEYGGGTVMIWDRGRWQPEGDPHKGLAKGHLAFTLDGEKLHGGWHLVRMRRRSGEKRDNWLLIKQHDDAERGPDDEDILEEQPRSAASGRTLDEISEDPKKVWRSNRGNSGKQQNASERTRNRKVVQTVPLGSGRNTGRSDDNSLAGARHAPLPAFVEPCLATLADKAPDSKSWIHEIKFDGYRVQARLDRGKVKLLTRKALDWTEKFPTIAAAVARLPVKNAVIDGEIVSEDSGGVSSFSLLQQDLKTDRHDRMAFYVFDLMHLDGADLRGVPLTTRKAALAKLIGNLGSRSPVRLSESLTERGTTLFSRACKLGLEGIISKLADTPYHSGRSRDWIKTKCSDRQELVVAGFVPSTADARAVGALVLGFYDRAKLHYAGRTGTGFTRDVARSLFRKLTEIKTDKSPFETIPEEERGTRKPIWVTPKMVVEVDIRGWTHGDRVRQASFQGVREDKAAKEVVREVKKSIAAVTATARRSAPSVKGDTRAKVGDITLTHPDRIYWADVGVSKRDLADYYTKVWKWMRPHLVGRPIALVRCPEGAEGQCFFQKHARAGIPTEHLHLVPEKGSRIISIDDLDGLIALVQGGVLEIHTRGTTIDDRERGDRLVFDLDPGPGTDWGDIVRAARDVRERLRRVKLKSFLKTSGGKGLHVVVPIKPAPWDAVKTFCKAVAESMELDEPDRYVSAAAKAKRSNRIFVDYLRNSREATAVAPYSTRARAGAPVSMPIDWSELSQLNAANQYTVQNAIQRLSRQKKDPWSTIGRVQQSLPKFD